MSIDCQWIEKNIEALVCERLSAAEAVSAHRHIEGCTDCRRKLDEMYSLDPLIRQLFRHELAVAQAPKRPRWSVLAGVPVAVTAIIALIVLRAPSPAAPPPMMSQVAHPAAVPDTVAAQAPQVPKTLNTPAQDRAKPQPAEPDVVTNPAPRTTAPPPTAENARPDFLVTDPAGYSRTLKDYSGHVLIFGLWNGKEPRTTASLERVYQTFGPNSKLRILGVAEERQRKPAAATFPIAYNQGSTLLGVHQSEFLIVDANGVVRARGSLIQDANAVVALVRSALAKINP